MSKALESALEAVRRMAPGAEIDAALWQEFLEEMRRNLEPHPNSKGFTRSN